MYPLGEITEIRKAVIVTVKVWNFKICARIQVKISKAKNCIGQSPGAGS